MGLILTLIKTAIANKIKLCIFTAITNNIDYEENKTR